jgi:hypothetical protein
MICIQLQNIYEIDFTERFALSLVAYFPVGFHVI